MRLPWPVPDVPGVRWSIQVCDLDDGSVLVERSPDRTVTTASIGKVFLLAEVARSVESGELRLDQQVSRTDEDAMTDSGLWHLMAQPTLTLGDACVLIGAMSDNLATNVVLRTVGLARVQRAGRALGFTVSTQLDKVREQRGPEHPYALSVGSARELCTYMSRLHRRELVSPGADALVDGWLAAGADSSMVAGAFDLDPLAHIERDRGVVLRNKTGTESRSRADIGHVRGPSGAVAYAVLAEWGDMADRGGDGDGARRAAVPGPGAVSSADGGSIGDPRGRVLAVMRELGCRMRSHVT